MAHTPARETLRLLGWNAQGDVGPLTLYTSSRGKLVAFAKAPPLNPPSQSQIRQRDVYRGVGTLWQALTHKQRDAWERAAKRANLGITGYNLFTYTISTNDHTAAATVARQTGIRLEGAT